MLKRVFDVLVSPLEFVVVVRRIARVAAYIIIHNNTQQHSGVVGCEAQRTNKKRIIKCIIM